MDCHWSCAQGAQRQLRLGSTSSGPMAPLPPPGRHTLHLRDSGGAGEKQPLVECLWIEERRGSSPPPLPATPPLPLQKEGGPGFLLWHPHQEGNWTYGKLTLDTSCGVFGNRITDPLGLSVQCGPPGHSEVIFLPPIQGTFRWVWGHRVIKRATRS